MNFREGFEKLIGRGPLSPEASERLVFKTLSSCVVIAHCPTEEAQVDVLDLFGKFFGISFPQGSNAKVGLVPAAVGSGFIADNRHIVTNNHVVEETASAQIHFVGKRVGNFIKRQIITGDVIARDVGNDLAILRIRDGEMPFPALRIQKTPVRIGQRVIAMKNPRVNAYSGSEALVEDFGVYLTSDGYGSVTHRTMKLRTGSVQRGDSGSPVIDTQGAVVGIMRSMNANDDTEGYAIPTEYALRLLKKARSV